MLIVNIGQAILRIFLIRRPEQLIPNMNGVANFILLRAEKAKLEAKA